MVLQISMEKSGLISIVVGAGAAWFGLYNIMLPQEEKIQISSCMDYYEIIGVARFFRKGVAAYKKKSMQHRLIEQVVMINSKEINEAYPSFGK